MKKSYSTPDIFFDSMALNENIADANQNCSRNITNMYANSCGLQFGAKVVFTLAAQGCKFKAQDGSPLFDGWCYHIPTAGRTLFNS